MTKRKRATRQEMIERLAAKLEKLQAQAAGNYDETGDSLNTKRLRSALRKRRTLLHRAETLLNGRAPTAKSPAQNGIDEKIENAQKRLDDLQEAKRRATEQTANLPFDIEKLEKLLADVENGETEVEFPTDLYRIPGENTVAETENAAANADDED
jgi:DNA repair exonuclease SbcCD ATPase subunit